MLIFAFIIILCFFWFIDSFTSLMLPLGKTSSGEGGGIDKATDWLTELVTALLSSWHYPSSLSRAGVDGATGWLTELVTDSLSA